jgi:hypothetical protein
MAPTVDAIATTDGLSPVPVALPVGTQATRFTILSRHAEGGLGRVYLARDEQLRRTVALKEIRPEAADENGRSGRSTSMAFFWGCSLSSSPPGK